ncbi:MAG: zinc-ribbon domain-containing protein [Clostridia bacterium]|nr:zinc-ribbon domain-containing protein [Clostridia bacterium]
MINCPECNHEISDKAHFCPHCGYPMIDPAEKKPNVRLVKGDVHTNNLSFFLKTLAVITIIGGFLVVILVPNSQEFLFTCTYSAFLLFSMAKIIDMIQATHDMINGMKLEQYTSEFSDRNHSAAQIQGSPAGTDEVDHNLGWRCVHCGTVNRNDRNFCSNCGEWKE